VRCLVTGPAGFVGSRVVRRLVADGHEVGAIMRPSSSRARLDGVEDRLVVFSGDLASPEGWRAQVAAWRPEACIHTAWYAEPGKYLDSTLNLDCLRDSLRLLEELAAMGCTRVVMTGTCFEYDLETGTLTEETPVRPRTLYAACKLALGAIGAQRAPQLGVAFAWGRIFYVYGPYEDPRRLVPALTLSLLRGEPFAATTGEQVRDYIHVDDIASALVALAVAGASGVYNIATGEAATIRDLMLEIGRLAGHADLIRFGARPPGQYEPPVINGDNRRLREATGWKPGRTLPQGLAETVEWWKARAALPR